VSENSDRQRRIETRLRDGAWALTADVNAYEALLRGLPVARGRLDPDTLAAIGEPLEGEPVELSEELALRALVAKPRPGTREESAPPAEREPETAEPFRIEVYSAKNLVALPLPQAEPELVGPFLRRGRIVLLGATTGHGKTTFGAQMLAAGVLGGEFLGFPVAGGLRVLVLDLEQHLEDIQEQLAAVGLADSELIDYAPIPEGLEIDRDPEQLAELERVVAAKAYDVVRVDPFYKLHAADSSDELQARGLVRLTRRWVHMHGFGLLMDTHTRKRIEARSRFTLDDLFGSSLLARDPETILGLQPLSDGFSRLHVFKARGRRGGIRTGQTIDLLYSDEELFRRKPEEEERALRAELIELGGDHVWRTLKEWRAKRGSPDADRSASDYVEQRGGIGAGEDAVKDALGELQVEGVFEYAEGADAGRSARAKCWRLATASDHQGSPRQSEAVGASRDVDGCTASLPSLPKGGQQGQGSRPSTALGRSGQSDPAQEEIERLAERARAAVADNSDAAEGGGEEE
jgi:AAA domain